MQRAGVDRPGLVFVEEHEVCGWPGSSEPPSSPKRRAGTVLSLESSMGSVSHAAAHQLGDAQRQRRLEPHDAVWRLFKGKAFFEVGMGGVVGGDEVDGAVGQRLTHGQAVARGAQRRVILAFGLPAQPSSSQESVK